MKIMDDVVKEEGWLLKEKYGSVATPEFERDREALRRGVPLAYLIGYVPFLDTVIYLDSRPLIPRTETEYWVRELINRHKNSPPTRILDLCAGSGAIGIALARAFRESRVDFAEIDTAHHATIAKNLEVNDIDTARTRILAGDLFAETLDHYDLIASNPPYLSTNRKADVASSVMEHEPHQALFAGEDGLDIIRRIIAAMPQHLLPGGSLYIEHEPYQTETIASIAKGLGAQSASHKDQYGLFRVTQIQL